MRLKLFFDWKPGRNIFKVFLAFVISFCGIYMDTLAQTTDAELWTGAEIRYEINKSFRMDVEQESRWNDNIGSFKYTYTEVGLRWRLSKIFSIKGKYRYVYIPNDYDRGKFYCDLNADLSKKRFPLILEYRLRYERGNEFVVSKTENWLRNSISLGWNLSKLADPYVGWENFRRLDGINMTRANRFTAGIDWRLSKKAVLSSFYMYEDEKNVKKPKDKHIAGLRLKYKLRTNNLKVAGADEP